MLVAKFHLLALLKGEIVLLSVLEYRTLEYRTLTIRTSADVRIRCLTSNISFKM